MMLGLQRDEIIAARDAQLGNRPVARASDQRAVDADKGQARDLRGRLDAVVEVIGDRRLPHLPGDFLRRRDVGKRDPARDIGKQPLDIPQRPVSCFAENRIDARQPRFTGFESLFAQIAGDEARDDQKRSRQHNAAGDEKRHGPNPRQQLFALTASLQQSVR